MVDSLKRNNCQPAWMFETYSAFERYDGAIMFQPIIQNSGLNPEIRWDHTDLLGVDRNI
jgi:hypothetical protein